MLEWGGGQEEGVSLVAFYASGRHPAAQQAQKLQKI